MPFTPRDWQDGVHALSAANLEDLEARLAAYADQVAAGGLELAYSELASTFNITGVGEAAAQDVTGLAITFTMPARPVMVRAHIPAASNATADKLVVISLNKTADNAKLGQTSVPMPVANLAAPIILERRLSLTDYAQGAAVSLKLRAWLNTGSTSGSILGTTTAPAFLQAIPV